MFCLLNSLPRLWNTYPLFIKVCFIISLLAITGIAMAMADIYLWRKTKKRKESKREQLSVVINQLLMSAVVAEPNKDSMLLPVDTAPFVALGLHHEHVRRVFVCECVNYRNYFTGAIAVRVRKLYLELGLDKKAKAMLHFKNWETTAHALLELFKMDVKVDHETLTQLSQSKNRYIRDFARLSMIKFTEGDPLDLLKVIAGPISKWEEFEIFLVFQQKENYRPGSLKELLSLNKEPSLVSLCLKLAVYFKDVSAIQWITGLIQAPSLSLRADAISALGQLGSESEEMFLSEIYYDQPHVIKLEILTALGRMQSNKSLEFLEHAFLSSTDFEIKKKASDAIIQLYPLSKETIDKLMSNTIALDNIILSHSLNPLINAL